jgi:hypothetical protein
VSNIIQAVNNVIELKPGHKYLLVFKGVTPEQMDHILHLLHSVGITGVGIGLEDGESLDVVEVPGER